MRHKTLQFYDKMEFDPVEYLKNNTILCQKYNYAVPENYGHSKVILSYNKAKDTLDIFNVDHLVNKSKNDDGQVISHGGAKYYKLEKQHFSIPVKDINGFIYGPFSTRFWMMRIGINQLIAENSFFKK